MKTTTSPALIAGWYECSTAVSYRPMIRPGTYVARHVVGWGVTQETRAALDDVESSMFQAESQDMIRSIWLSTISIWSSWISVWDTG